MRDDRTNGAAALGRRPPSTAARAPAVVIALGDFGREVLAALAAARPLRPALPEVVGLWAGPDGWHTSQMAVSSRQWAASDQPPAEEWWQAHAVATAGHLRAAVLPVLRAASAGRAPLDLYLVAHLNEAAGRTLWARVLAAAQAACAPLADHVFTLILAADTLAFDHFDPAEAQAYRAALDDLAGVLAAAADEQERPGRVGWCYLLDTLDTNGRPLRGAEEQWSRGAGESTPLPAHYAAEFIALLCAGLRRTPAYERTSLAHLSRDLRGRAPAAWVSAFAAASLALPVPLMAGQARDALARDLLAGSLMGQEAPGDLPAARQLRARWLAECTLGRAALRNRLQRDHGGQPLAFPLEPPQVDETLDRWPDEVPGLLEDWDWLLEQRWGRPDAPPASLRQNADALAQEAAAWLNAEVDGLLQHEAGGARLAPLVVREVERAIEEERLQGEEPPPAGRHWLAVLLDALPIPRRDPTAIPDFTPYRRRLTDALRRRVNRQAVWTRASLYGVVVLAFVWAAYLAAGPVLSLHRFMARWLGLNPPAPVVTSLDLAAMALLAWLVALLLGGAQIYVTELALHRAINGHIAAIERKYRALLERALRQERERVYAALYSEAARWRVEIERRRQVMNEALATLDAERRNGSDPAPLLTEQWLLAPGEWAGLRPRFDPADLRRLADLFLRRPQRPAWRTETAADLLAALRAFAAAELAGWQARLTLAAWSAEQGRPDSLGALLAGLRAGWQPGWPLGPDGQAAVLAQPERPVASARVEGALPPHLVTHFIGLPDAAGEPPLLAGLGPRDALFSTGEGGRLAYVPTIHALELPKLHAWEKLLAVSAQPSAFSYQLEANGRPPTADGRPLTAEEVMT